MNDIKRIYPNKLNAIQLSKRGGGGGGSRVYIINGNNEVLKEY